MGLAFLSVAIFVSGWCFGRWDLRPWEQPLAWPRWLRGTLLLWLCASVIFLGALYLALTPKASWMLGPVLLQQPT